MVAWSYSSIKTFEQCPKKYFHLKIAKDVQDNPGTAAIYGTAVHTAAEEYVRDGTPIPEKFAYMRPIVERLEKLPGKKHCELELAVRKDLSPCGFSDPDAWWRGIIDLIVINDNRAWMVDYKTGKSARYADTKQLDLMAGAVFAHFPNVLAIKSSLMFVVSGELIAKKHVLTERDQYMSVFNEQVENLEASLENGVWNPKSGPLCGWCPVSSCAHWKSRRN